MNNNTSKKNNLFSRLFSFTSVQDKVQGNNHHEGKNVQLLQLTKTQQEQLLAETQDLLKQKIKLQQMVRIQQQENEAQAEDLYTEILDIYDSLEFLINYLDNNLQADDFNPKALKRLPKFVVSMQEKLLTILSRREVEKINFDGDIPDFSVCQVVEREKRDDIPEQTITRIVRQGFKLKDKVLRPVEVITAKKSENS